VNVTGGVNADVVILNDWFDDHVVDLPCFAPITFHNRRMELYEMISHTTPPPESDTKRCQGQGRRTSSAEALTVVHK
jgi:hypothetical protein